MWVIISAVVLCLEGLLYDAERDLGPIAPTLLIFK